MRRIFDILKLCSPLSLRLFSLKNNKMGLTKVINNTIILFRHLGFKITSTAHVLNRVQDCWQLNNLNGPIT